MQILSIIGLAIIVGLSNASAEAKTFKVDCDKGKSIQQRLDNNVKDGDTVEVSGACTENVEIAQDRVTLECVGGASITGVAAAAPANTNVVKIRASDVVVRNCDIRGGDAPNTAVIIIRSGSAGLFGNTVSGSNSGGVSVSQNSYGRIVGNEVTGSAGSGVSITSGSMADVANNNIHDNGSNGMTVLRSAAADVVGNDIVDNVRSGVFVSRTSSVAFSNDATLGDAPNLIQGNDDRGIGCFDNSALQFGKPQDFGTGNGNPNGTGPNTVFEGGGFCATSGTP